MSTEVSRIMGTTIKKGSLFRRKVIQRQQDRPIDEIFQHPFPDNKWFWCYPAADNSSSVKGNILKEYEYKATEDFVVVTGDELLDILPDEFERDIKVFNFMSHPVHELRVIQAVLQSAEGVIGITREIGSGVEYVFISGNVTSLLSSTDLTS